MGENDIAFFLENHNEEALMKNEGKSKVNQENTEKYEFVLDLYHRMQ